MDLLAHTGEVLKGRHERSIESYRSKLFRPSAAIFPIFGAFAKARSIRIAFNVTQQRQKMRVDFDRESLESTLVPMPRSFLVVMSVSTHRMSHRRCELPISVHEHLLSQQAMNQLLVVDAVHSSGPTPQPQPSKLLEFVRRSFEGAPLAMIQAVQLALGREVGVQTDVRHRSQVIFKRL